MIKNLKKGGTFLLNTTFNAEEIINYMPNKVKKQLAEKEAKFYIINAVDIARELGMGRHTNTILQSAFFKLSPSIMNYDDALKYMKQAAYKAYSKKGDAIVELNYKAIDRGADALVEVKVDPAWKNLEVTKLGQEALEYLHKRGLNDETIKVFDIGLAPAEHSILYQVLKESNYFELDMIDLGLVGSNDRGYHDLFVNRIMFPIKNENGDVIAFSGRIFNTTDKNQAKYINTKETFIFKKGNTLFNFNNAKSEIMKKRGFTNKSLSEKLKYPAPSGVSERLRGKQDMRADTLVKFLEAMDCEVVIRSKLSDKLEYIIKDEPTIEDGESK
jgi:hypothetical protein